MTNISELYDTFLSKISDYSFLDPNLTQQDINEELFGYFKSARAKFYRCKQSLNTITNDLGEVLIESDLTPFEMEILVSLMLVEYMKPIINSSETLKQSLSDKDFRIYSQANQLRELNLLHSRLKKEANSMITEYGYMGIDKQ